MPPITFVHKQPTVVPNEDGQADLISMKRADASRPAELAIVLRPLDEKGVFSTTAEPKKAVLRDVLPGTTKVVPSIPSVLNPDGMVTVDVPTHTLASGLRAMGLAGVMPAGPMPNWSSEKAANYVKFKAEIEAFLGRTVTGWDWETLGWAVQAKAAQLDMLSEE